jgi:hypothetical protein
MKSYHPDRHLNVPRKSEDTALLLLCKNHQKNMPEDSREEDLGQ